MDNRFNSQQVPDANRTFHNQNQESQRGETFQDHPPIVAAAKPKKTFVIIWVVVVLLILGVAVALIIHGKNTVNASQKGNLSASAFGTGNTSTFKVGDIVTLGSYEQDNNLSNGKESIKWQILALQDGKALLISKYGLDCQKYSVSQNDMTWETCSLRAWLNNAFLKEAFSEEEADGILTTTVIAGTDKTNAASSGKDTQDQIFLLSIDEAENYFPLEEDRLCEITDYTVSKGAFRGPSRHGCWWLRDGVDYKDSIGYATGTVVDDIGNIMGYYFAVENDLGCVRPAMWVDVSILSSGNPQTETQKGDDTSPVIGSIVTFGGYEQDGNYSNGKEEIEWIVLDSKDGKTLLLSKYALDTGSFNLNNHKEKTWESSDLRKWLNSDFYSSAFNAQEQKMIPLETIPGDPGFACEEVNDTEDYVFLLGSSELENYSELYPEILNTEPTDYVINITRESYDTSWWLRSAGDMSNMECVSLSETSGTYYIDSGGRLQHTELLVRPALWVVFS